MAQTVTLELTADEAFWMQQLCVDAGSYWHSLWQDATNGKRPDLDVESCSRLSRKAWDFYQKLESA